MANYINDESYPTINTEHSSKTVDIVYVKIDRDKSSETLKSSESFFRLDPEYRPRKYDTSNNLLPASQPKKL